MYPTAQTVQLEALQQRRQLGIEAEQFAERGEVSMLFKGTLGGGVKENGERNRREGKKEGEQENEGVQSGEEREAGVRKCGQKGEIKYTTCREGK